MKGRHLLQRHWVYSICKSKIFDYTSTKEGKGKNAQTVS